MSLGELILRHVIELACYMGESFFEVTLVFVVLQEYTHHFVGSLKKHTHILPRTFIFILPEVMDNVRQVLKQLLAIASFEGKPIYRGCC